MRVTTRPDMFNVLQEENAMNELLLVWSDSTAVSAAIWLVIAMIVLFFGRPHAHHLFNATGMAIYSVMRLAATSVRQLETRVAARNRDVLLAAGREEMEKSIEQEFNRVNTLVERELSHYPELHRKVADTIDQVAADYHAATNPDPLPPAWTDVMDTIQSLPGNGDPSVTKVLDNIKDAVEASHQQTLKAHQKNCAERHKILASMQPQWRSLNQSVGEMQQTITGLEEHSKSIDRQMAEYESMRRGEDRAANTLLASSFTQLIIASLVLVIAAFGGLINFHLIALPMSEMVGGGAYIGSVRMSDIAALVIIMVEIAMGLFLLESLRITKLFPVIGRMDDRMRKRMMWVALSILTIFATIEASLAYMRDLLALDREALQQSLAGAAVAEAQFRWIPSVAQMMLGFILPFALAFVAIPLESFIHSARTVLGVLVLALLRVARIGLRALGGLARHTSRMLISVYDLFIMLPLGVEQRIRDARSGRIAQQEAAGGDTDAAPAPAQRTKKKSGRSSRHAEQSNDDSLDSNAHVAEAGA